MNYKSKFDAIIIGGGPAGLSTATILGRSCRNVLVLDSGKYRNAASRSMHGYLTRDGISPSDFLEIARNDLKPYSNVQVQFQKAIDARRDGPGFIIECEDGSKFHSRKLVLATGVEDKIPPVTGAKEAYGKWLFHCPYCDGWENRDSLITIYGKGDNDGAGLALEMTQWSKNISLCTDGPGELSPACRSKLASFHISVYEQKILRLTGIDADRNLVSLDDGKSLECKAMFFNTSRQQNSDLAHRLGCAEYGAEGCTLDQKYGMTSIPGLFIVGDASRDILQVITAAGEGAQAAIEINKQLLNDDGVL